jgi:hypothetical protein
MIRNYLKGTIGDAMNLMLAASAMNFKRVMNLWKQRTSEFLYWLIDLIVQCFAILSSRKVEMTF